MKKTKIAKDIYHMNYILEKMQLKPIEMEIQLVMYVENIIYLEPHYGSEIKSMMELQNL